MKPIWLALMSTMFLAGCAGAAGIESSLQSMHGPLAYLYDSEKVAAKQPESIRIGSVMIDDVLPPTTTVQEESGFFLPLLVVNVWKYDYQSQLGSAQLSNDYKAFIKESFANELARSGKFSYVDGPGDMEVDLKIKAISMRAPMRKAGNVIFLLYAVSYSQSYWAGPAEVQVTAEAVLKKEGKEIFHQEFRGTGVTGLLQGKNLDIGDFTTAMIEALSSALKNLNENVVREINKV